MSIRVKYSLVLIYIRKGEVAHKATRKFFKAQLFADAEKSALKKVRDFEEEVLVRFGGGGYIGWGLRYNLDLFYSVPFVTRLYDLGHFKPQTR